MAIMLTMQGVASLWYRELQVEKCALSYRSSRCILCYRSWSS